MRGNVKGIVRAKGKIEIKKDGSVIGDLTTAQILIGAEEYLEAIAKPHFGSPKLLILKEVKWVLKPVIITKECLPRRGPRCTTASN